MSILVAEKDPFWQRRWQALDLPWPVEVVADGALALERAFREPPAALVCEALLPVLDGLALIRRIRAHPLTRHVPAAIVSSLPLADRAREAGADFFLQKPLADRDLRNLARRLVTRPAGEGRDP